MTPRFDDRMRVSPSEALAKLPGEEGERFRKVFQHGTLEVEIYAPQGADAQTPHAQDEVYVVIAGTGTFMRDGVRVHVTPGDFLFAPAGVEHRFENFSDDFAVWVLFYGPDGGERPRS